MGLSSMMTLGRTRTSGSLKRTFLPLKILFFIKTKKNRPKMCVTTIFNFFFIKIGQKCTSCRYGHFLNFFFTKIGGSSSSGKFLPILLVTKSLLICFLKIRSPSRIHNKVREQVQIIEGGKKTLKKKVL